MVGAYVDGELSVAESAEFERALETCPECRRRLEETRAVSGLLRDLPAEPAPGLLRAKVERELRTIVGRQSLYPFERLRWMAVAASLVVALGIGWIGATLVGQSGREADAVMAAYLRIAMSDHPVEVASSDRHTVKPWFAGRIDYAPPVHDLTTAGFPLVGGRLDIVDGRKVAVMVYRRNRHWIALTAWPARSAGDVAADVTQRDGFALADWRRGGFELRAVGDLAPADMKSFVTALDRAVDGDR
jgi:anti-sigma factor RsiW